jgi:hypothetical protein
MVAVTAKDRMPPLYIAGSQTCWYLVAILLARILSAVSLHAERDDNSSGNIRMLDTPAPRVLEDKPEVRAPDRFSKLVLAAAERAMGCVSEKDRPDGLACVLGSAFGTRATMEDWLLSTVEGRANPSLFPATASAVSLGHLARIFDITKSVGIVNAASPLPTALEWIRSGRESTVLVVATEELRGGAPDLLAATCQGSVFAEASAAVVLAKDSAERSQTVGIVEYCSVTHFQEADLADAKSPEVLAESSSGILPEIDAGAGAWGLCSVGEDGPDMAEPEGYEVVVYPRKTAGDTLGASSLVALCSTIDQLTRGGPRRWLVNDVDRAGGALSMIVSCG